MKRQAPVVWGASQKIVPRRRIVPIASIESPSATIESNGGVSANYVFKILCLPSLVDKILGPAGQTKDQLQHDTGAILVFNTHDGDFRDSRYLVLGIFANDRQQVVLALERILAMLVACGEAERLGEKPHAGCEFSGGAPGQYVLRLCISKRASAFVIGGAGSTIDMLRWQCSVKIFADSRKRKDYQQFRVIGYPDGLLDCAARMVDLIQSSAGPEEFRVWEDAGVAETEAAASAAVEAAAAHYIAKHTPKLDKNGNPKETSKQRHERRERAALRKELEVQQQAEVQDTNGELEADDSVVNVDSHNDFESYDPDEMEQAMAGGEAIETPDEEACAQAEHMLTTPENQDVHEPEQILAAVQACAHAEQEHEDQAVHEPYQAPAALEAEGHDVREVHTYIDGVARLEEDLSFMDERLTRLRYGLSSYFTARTFAALADPANQSIASIEKSTGVKIDCSEGLALDDPSENKVIECIGPLPNVYAAHIMLVQKAVECEMVEAGERNYTQIESLRSRMLALQRQLSELKPIGKR